jgi:hypothetical protein
MERDYGERTQVALEVVIAYPGLGLVRGRTRDVGFDGAFVETGRVMLPMYAAVEVTFTVGRGEARHSVPLKGFISHVSRKGVGVLFNEDNASLEPAMRILLGKRRDRDAADSVFGRGVTASGMF